MLRVEDVAKFYPTDGHGQARVLDHLSLELGAAETMSLVGASGSGKSTLISLIAGMLLPDSGGVFVDGHDMTALDEPARAKLRASRIGVVLQSGNLIPFLTAQENVELAIGLGGGKGRGARAREVLSAFGLRDRLHHKPARLSGGEAQRVALCVALANDPAILLADEVTGELDEATAERVMDLIFEAARERGLGVLFVTHSGEQAARAQRRLRLADGRVHEQ